MVYSQPTSEQRNLIGPFHLPCNKRSRSLAHQSPKSLGGRVISLECITWRRAKLPQVSLQAFLQLLNCPTLACTKTNTQQTLNTRMHTRARAHTHTHTRCFHSFSKQHNADTRTPCLPHPPIPSSPHLPLSPYGCRESRGQRHLQVSLEP